MRIFTGVDLFSRYVAITYPLREETAFRESAGVSVSDILLASLLCLPV